MATLNTSLVAIARKTQEAMLAASLACIDGITKEKLDDSTDKAFYVRMERNIHNSCEALDGKSYRNAAQYENGPAFKVARAKVRDMKSNRTPKPATPVATPNTTNES